jgi:hypothetical protein
MRCSRSRARLRMTAHTSADLYLRGLGTLFAAWHA